MLQLIYTSIATQEQWDGDVQRLCQQSEANNARDEITGVLVCQDGMFLQVIEGPRTLVEDAFLRIMLDRRHHGVLLLSRKLMLTRQFGNWKMAGVEAAADRDAIVSAVRALIGEVASDTRQEFDRRFAPASTPAIPGVAAIESPRVVGGPKRRFR